MPGRDLNVGAIVALAPDLSVLTSLLGVDDATVRAVLRSWGPGKFDAELVLDGKALRPDGKSAATLIPPAFGPVGVNLHTWTGWGSVTYWSVAVLEMLGQGTFFDPRLDDAAQFLVAAKAGFGNVRSSQDLVTPKLASLHFYQLAIASPPPLPGSFDAAGAERGRGSSTGRGSAHDKGGFFHDGRFATLRDVVDHCNTFFGLGLGDGKKNDLVEYLKSI